MSAAGRHIESADRPDPRWWTWLRILRAPNLLTVPGDPLAGFLLAFSSAASPERLPAMWASLWPVMGASLLFYAAGLLINDVADIETDRIERPARPLPSRAIGVATARNAAMGMLMAALGLCFLAGERVAVVGGTLAAAILSYNLWTKRLAVIGPLNMGLCRALNLLLGAAVVGVAPPLLVGACAGLTAYIASVTYVARLEMVPRRSDWSGWVPAVVVIGLMGFFVRHTGAEAEAHARMTGAFLFAFLVASLAALRGRSPATIGLWVGSLIPIQSAFCLGSNAGAAALASGFGLLVLWPLNRLLLRHFAGS